MGDSVKGLYEEGLRLQARLEKVNPMSSEFADLHHKATQTWTRCQAAMDRAGFFSSNEDSEDLATGDIQFMSIDYRLATLAEKTRTTDITERRKLVVHTANLLTRYLLLLESYKILPKSFSSSLRDAIGDRTLAGLPATYVPDFSRLQPTDPVARREQKISLFKLEKSLAAKIDAVNKRINPGEDAADSADDETLRSARFAQLGVFAIRAVSSLQTLGMEIELLSNMPDSLPQPQPTETSDSRTAASASTPFGTSTRLETLPSQQPLLTKSGNVSKVNRPFTIVSSKREKLLRSVQGTGQYMPTMSVEEYLEEEIKQGGIIEGGGEASKQTESSDEDDEEKQDEKTYKARAWDEFTEANPRGSGNTINRG